MATIIQRVLHAEDVHFYRALLNKHPAVVLCNYDPWRDLLGSTPAALMIGPLGRQPSSHY